MTKGYRKLFHEEYEFAETFTQKTAGTSGVAENANFDYHRLNS